MRATSFVVLFAMGLTLASSAVPQGAKQAPEKILRTFTVRGSVVGFEMGDYTHVILKTAKGEQSYFVGGPGVDYYLALNARKTGTFKIVEVDCYFEEAGGRMTIERVQSARIGKQSSSAWWAATRKKMSLDAIDKKFGPMVTKLIRN